MLSPTYAKNSGESSLFFNHAVLTSFQALSDTPVPLLLLLDETLPSVPPHNLAPGIALIFDFNSRTCHRVGARLSEQYHTLQRRS